MSENHWYPFYMGDYGRKTAHLSMMEHGAYRLLIDHYYATRTPLPNDPAKLYRICRARSPSERKAVLSVAAEFFSEDGTLLRHEKCDSVIDKQLKYSESQSANAKRRHSEGNATAPARTRAVKTKTKTTDTTTAAAKDNAVGKIVKRACELFPALDGLSSDVVSYWLEQGCDPDKDILPCIERARGRALNSFGYFTEMVIEAMQERTSKHQQSKTPVEYDRWLSRLNSSARSDHFQLRREVGEQQAVEKTRHLWNPKGGA